MKKLLAEFKKMHNLDFRIHKHYEHSYFYNAKSSTYFDYYFAKKIVQNLNDFLIEEFGNKLVIYNIEMDIESLKGKTLKNYIELRIEDYVRINKDFLQTTDSEQNAILDKFESDFASASSLAEGLKIAFDNLPENFFQK